MGHSLGGVFLAKYFSEEDFSKEIIATFLVSAPYGDNPSEYKLLDFSLPQSLEKFEKQGAQIFIYHSEDDDVVPFTDLDKYSKTLPEAKRRIFKDRGHFNQEEFPELVEDIKSL